MKKDPYDGRWNTHDIPSLLFQDLGKGQTCAKNMFRFICAKDRFLRILPEGFTRQTLAQRTAKDKGSQEIVHKSKVDISQSDELPNQTLQRLKA